jgi:hypothetical protein
MPLGTTSLLQEGIAKRRGQRLTLPTARCVQAVARGCWSTGPLSDHVDANALPVAIDEAPRGSATALAGSSARARRVGHGA